MAWQQLQLSHILSQDLHLGSQRCTCRSSSRPSASGNKAYLRGNAACPSSFIRCQPWRGAPSFSPGRPIEHRDRLACQGCVQTDIHIRRAHCAVQAAEHSPLLTCLVMIMTIAPKKSMPNSQFTAASTNNVASFNHASIANLLRAQQGSTCRRPAVLASQACAESSHAARPGEP